MDRVGPSADRASGPATLTKADKNRAAQHTRLEKPLLSRCGCHRRHHRHDPPRPVQRLPARDRSDPLNTVPSPPLMAACRPRWTPLEFPTLSTGDDARTQKCASPPVRRGLNRSRPVIPPSSTPHRADMGTPASVKPGTIHPGRRERAGRAIDPTRSHRSTPARRPRRPCRKQHEGPRNPGGLSRSKPVRRTQRRSGGLDDGLEGRTPDVEAPAARISSGMGRPDPYWPASSAEIHARICRAHGLAFLSLDL